MSSSTTIAVEPLELPFDVLLPMPRSKSHANRAIIAGCLAQGTTFLHHATPCDDVALLVQNVQKIGFRVQWIDRAQGILKITGGLPKKPGRATLHCENAGTTLRFLTALCAITPGEWTVTGNERMKERPIGDLTKALRQLGADIEDQNGFPPIRIIGKPLMGGFVTLDASKSGQFLSALLLIAPLLKKGLNVRIASTLASATYIDLTRSTLKHFGILVKKSGKNFHVSSGRMRSPRKMQIEGDWSAAGAFLVLAELTGSSVICPNLDRNSTQGDAQLPTVIRKIRGNGKCVIDCRNFPDQVMNIAVLAAHRKGETILTGAENLRIKETDRLAILTKELKKAGIRIEERKDGLRIRYSPRLRSATLDPHDDHRMAMAFAILGSMHPSIRIRHPDCVKKSYPNFWKDLRTLKKSPRCIAIIGMRGVGKSTLAKNAARPLGLHHIDSDAVFWNRYGDFQQVLRIRGWPFFRKHEERIVRESLKPRAIISLGGGAVESAQTRAALKSYALVVWLQEPLKTVLARLRRLKRPALTNLSLEEEARMILKRRTPFYKQLAEITLPPSLPRSKQVSSLRSALRSRCSW